MQKTDTMKIGDKKYVLSSKWSDVWGDWQFWWYSAPADQPNAEWEVEANGDIKWAQRMSAHYKVNITGEYPDSEVKGGEE